VDFYPANARSSAPRERPFDRLGIAQAMRREGCDLAFNYANDRFKERVVELAAQAGSNITMPMDVTSDEQIEAAFGR